MRVTSMRHTLGCCCSFSKACCRDRSLRTVLYGSHDLGPPFSPVRPQNLEEALGKRSYTCPPYKTVRVPVRSGMPDDDRHPTKALHYDCGGVGLSRTLSEAAAHPVQNGCRAHAEEVDERRWRRLGPMGIARRLSASLAVAKQQASSREQALVDVLLQRLLAGRTPFSPELPPVDSSRCRSARLYVWRAAVLACGGGGAWKGVRACPVCVCVCCLCVCEADYGV